MGNPEHARELRKTPLVAWLCVGALVFIMSVVVVVLLLVRGPSVIPPPLDAPYYVYAIVIGSALLLSWLAGALGVLYNVGHILCTGISAVGLAGATTLLFVFALVDTPASTDLAVLVFVLGTVTPIGAAVLSCGAVAIYAAIRRSVGAGAADADEPTDGEVGARALQPPVDYRQPVAAVADTSAAAAPVTYRGARHVMAATPDMLNA